MSEELDNDNDFFSTTRVIEVNGVKFTVGLAWEPITSASSLREEINTFAREEGMNLVTVYQSLISVQAGFAQVDLNHVKRYAGSYSLASVLAERLGDSWLAVFDMKDGDYVLIAVRDGMILPGCDIIGGLKEVTEVLSDIVNIHDWGRVLVSNKQLLARVGAADIGHQDEASLDELISEKRYSRELRVKHLKRGIDKRVMIGGVALISLAAISGVSYFVYQNYIQSYLDKIQVEQDARNGIIRARQVEGDRAKAIERLEELTIKPSWDKAPKADAVLGSCYSGILSLPMSAVGWVMEKASCADGRVVASYARLPGSTMNQMQAWATQSREDGVISGFSVNPDSARITVTLQKIEPRGLEPLFSEKQWVRSWVSHFQALGLPSSLKPVEHPAPPVPDKRMVDLLGKEKAVPPPPWWVTQEWSFSADGLSAPSVLAKWPGEGFVVKSVDVTMKDLPQWLWEARGEIHVKP